MRLAVATPNPDAVAETYVRQHMRRILPGRTVGLGLSCGEDRKRGIPFHCVDPVEGRLMSKLTVLDGFLRTGYAAAIPRAQEAKVMAFFRKYSVGAVLAEFGTTGCALRRVCGKMGLRLVVNFHGYDATVMPKRRLIRFAYRNLARDAHSFVCGSLHFKRILVDIGFPEEKVFVVPCGLELEEFSAGKERDRSLILAVGRLTEKKRPDLLIRAFALAHREHPSIRLEMIGEGLMWKTCESLISELGLTGNVIMHGARDHTFVKEKLAAAGMFAQHSVTASNGDQESQGISLVEAMAASLPVVATDHNGFSETVSHGVTGLLSPEGDVQAMAGNIAVLAGNDALRIAYGRNGRARAEAKFDAEASAARLRELLFATTLPAGARS